MEKPTANQFPIHDLLRKRWSPRAFARRQVEVDSVLSLFEAARWAPSGGNLQPWAFIVTMQGIGDGHERFVELINPNNAVWAKHAPLLVLAVARRERNPGQPNFYALYDVGQAVADLTVQATALGLVVHQMGGFDRPRSRDVFSIPEAYDPVIALAIGYPGEPENLPPDLREREQSPRVRRTLGEFVFGETWEHPLYAEPAER